MTLSVCTEIILRTFTLISTLEEARLSPTFFTRKRKMPFQDILKFLLQGKKEATQAALNEFFQGKGDVAHMTQQALSKVRSHFDHTHNKKSNV